jgi:hypothetical protein
VLTLEQILAWWQVATVSGVHEGTARIEVSVNSVFHEEIRRFCSFFVRPSTSFVSEYEIHWCLSPKLHKQCDLRRIFTSDNIKRIDIPKTAVLCTLYSHADKPCIVSSAQRSVHVWSKSPLEWTGVCNIISIIACVNCIVFCLFVRVRAPIPLCAWSRLTGSAS